MASPSTLSTVQGHIEGVDAAATQVRSLFNSHVFRPRTALLPVVAIAVASDDDRGRLTEIMGALNAQVVPHQSLRTLRRSLLHDDVDLVITDVTLADANWADVMRLIVRASLATGILVHSQVADERLRSEVMWRGADGLLAPPYSPDGIRQIIENALERKVESVKR